MSQFNSKPLIVALLLVLADRSAAVAQGRPFPPPPPPHELGVPHDPVCYDYYMKMHDIEIGTLEYLTQRNKQLEFNCGAFGRAAPKK